MPRFLPESAVERAERPRERRMAALTACGDGWTYESSRDPMCSAAFWSSLEMGSV
jgi:hypothetical protein